MFYRPPRKPSGLYREPDGTVQWIRNPPDIVAVDMDASYDQTIFAWGDPGTESGHTIGTEDADVVLVGGSGDVRKFLRFKITQDQASADVLRTQAFKVVLNTNGGGYGDIPLTAGSNKVYISDHASITQDDDTTNRLTSAETFLTPNGHVLDTADQGSALTFPQNVRREIEVLISLTFQDAQLVGGDVLDFKVVFGAGGDTAEDTVLDSYGVADATATWSIAPEFDGDGFRWRDNVPDPSGVDAAFDAGDSAAGTDITWDVDTLIRLRMLIKQIIAKAGGHADMATSFLFQYNNVTQGSGWLTLGDEGTSVEDVICSLATGFVDSDNTTVQRVGSGTFVNGESAEINATTGAMTFNDGAISETELELSLELVGANVSGGDDIDIRVLYSAADEAPAATAMAATDIARITVSGGAAAPIPDLHMAQMQPA